MDGSTRDNNADHEDEIRMWREDDGWVITYVVLPRPPRALAVK